MYIEQGFPLSASLVEETLRIVKLVDISPGPGGSRITPVSQLLLQTIPCMGSFAVVALYPSSQLVCHCDPPIAGTRFHVPLQVNEGCWCFHDGVWQQLEIGKFYRMDPTKPHGAVNWGTEVRLHLIIDTHG